MPFGLTIGTERAAALQQSIQDELTKRGYSPDADPVMAEYITIMVINNKTAAQITSELEDLIGSDFKPSFTDWLFEEAAKGVFGAQSPPPIIEQPAEPEPSREGTSNIVNDSSRTAPNVPRNGVYQQAITQALPPTSTSAQKRTASARSPSPNHPNKSRRTDLPVGPRAMYRDGNSNSNVNPHPNSRSLLDRVGGPAGRPGPKNFQRDEIQARIDNIVGNTPDPNMMMAAGFPGMGMDMNAIAAANMANPLMLQEMMMNQMALMAQMASSMGIINPNTGQFAGQGFPMQQGVMPGVMPGDMGIFPNGMIDGFSQQGGNNGPMNGAGRGRGSVRGARGSSRGRGGPVGGNSAGPSTNTNAPTIENSQVSRPPIPIVEPKPVTPLPTATAPSAAGLVATPATSQQPAYAIPDRPQSPTLCKFALKCTNAHCRYSHPSPVATAESGVVLSNEACANGKECKDKDCIKAHVSPAVLNPLAAEQPAPIATTPHVHHTPTPCRFGSACTRPACTFSHPPRPSHNHFAQQCRFGAGCTRAQCPFQHPEGRVLPSSFHRGLSTTGPMVNVPTPEPGSMGGPSHHRSVTFNTATTNESVKEKLERQMKEIQEKKSEAERAVRNAEAAANKKDEAKPVSIAV
ncbi:hypothetical protein BYT27DRAFT_7101694 [Phlegmacium glaucopus]|nr:hypothetical protein BYT27DRAFT_7101694 [Phlegmacium glaucopus]